MQVRRAATKDSRIAAFIKHRRESLGLSQVDLANACSVTKQAVSNWEVGGSQYIRPKHLVALARVLDVSVENLVKGSVKQSVYLTEDEYMLLEIGKSTRLNSSHLGISYAVFCLKKKKNNRFK